MKVASCTLAAILIPGRFTASPHGGAYGHQFQTESSAMWTGLSVCRSVQQGQTHAGFHPEQPSRWRSSSPTQTSSGGGALTCECHCVAIDPGGVGHGPPRRGSDIAADRISLSGSNERLTPLQPCPINTSPASPIVTKGWISSPLVHAGNQTSAPPAPIKPTPDSPHQ